MTTLLQSPPGHADRGSDLDALATAELRAACEGGGFPVPGARISFVGEGPVLRVVVRIPSQLPWRVADAAVVRALQAVRSSWPETQFSDRRYEDCLLSD